MSNPIDISNPLMTFPYSNMNHFYIIKYTFNNENETKLYMDNFKKYEINFIPRTYKSVYVILNESFKDHKNKMSLLKKHLCSI